MSLKLSKKQREELRLKFGGRCAYCGCQLPEKGWHADHIEPIVRDFIYNKNKQRFKTNGVCRNPENEN